ncbi:MAG: cbb3-type cytochrome c oxidase subunit 3 [Gammaproteobacteria bacterium]|nr:cbb3-type cytochrome c oxidase subunit 3 [Gammaproteobacteria bacterium]MCF6363126.1 cbb3-type cytochrome c oxidase subunit 3 [Gammaproteobacteria bacterium]
MTSLQEYFYTDWAALTSNDWVGLIMTVVVFFLMIAIYVYALHPSNREKLEAQRFIPLDEDRLDTEGRK